MHSRLESFRTDSQCGSTGGYGSLCDIGHQGLLHDKEFGPAATGLVHNRRRTLNPLLGRFNQCDPLGYPDGMSGYEYCGSSPPGYIDPEGTLKWSAKFLTWAADAFGTLMTPDQKKEYKKAQNQNRHDKMRELAYRKAASGIVTWEFKCAAKNRDGRGLLIVDKSGAGPKKVTSTNNKIIWAVLAKAADLVGLKAKTQMIASIDASVSDAVQFNSIGRKCKRIGLTYKAAVQYDGGIDIMAPAKLLKLPHAPTIMLDKTSIGAQNVLDVSFLVCCTCRRGPKNQRTYGWQASWLSLDETGQSGMHGDMLLSDVTAILGASSEKKKWVPAYDPMNQNSKVLTQTKQWKDNKEQIWTVPVE
jgi:RHS repeat-associated protein